MDTEFSPDVAKIPADEPSCAFLKKGENMNLHVLYTAHPNDGLSIVFRKNQTNPAFPPGYGAAVVSNAGCLEGLPCIDDVLYVPLRVTGGMSMWNYVHTDDQSLPDHSTGRRRSEWFGIHAGPAIVGEMGFGNALGVTAVGDTVNTASRVEALTKEFKCQLILSQSTLAMAGLELGELPREEIDIRGRNERLTIHLVEDASTLALES